ncbi:MAG: hypothetical protein mread185_000384 [Mycoplasmataceae bacterium]|nr:MAG: hypothetical protein mread185_000384 [Mycoplasmataceae bacterium]
MNWYNEYKGMNWYSLLGFSENKINDSGLSREEYCLKYLEIAYQNCLSMVNRGNLEEINKFYKTQTLNFYKGKIENIQELRERIKNAYHTLKVTQKMKEYEFEIYGIFSRDYPEREIADAKFKDRAIQYIETDEEWELSHVWKEYLSSDYWKKWREKLITFKHKEEIKFYIMRYQELRIFILKITNWGKEPQFGGKIDYEKTSKIISQKEIELQNMSKEEYVKKTNQPPPDGEWREMNYKEIKDSFFGDLPDYGWNFENRENQQILEKENKTSLFFKRKEFIWTILAFLFIFSLSLVFYFCLKKKNQSKYEK